jgi:hypothetical protein
MATSQFTYVWLLPLLERPRQDVEGDMQAALDALPLKEPGFARLVGRGNRHGI